MSGECRSLIVRWSPANPWWWGHQRILYWYHMTFNGVRY